MQRTRSVAICSALVAIFLLIALYAHTHPSQAERPTGGRTQTIETTAAAPSTDLSAGLLRAQAYVEFVTALDVQTYVNGVIAGQVGDYITAVQAAEAEAARLAAARVVVPSYVAPSAPRGNVTGACGGATNGADQFIGRESGGDPNVYNTGGSGAWGCYQLMPMHFAPGATCSDMVYGQASPAQQAECASRLPLSAWGG